MRATCCLAMALPWLFVLSVVAGPPIGTHAELGPDTHSFRSDSPASRLVATGPVKGGVCGDTWLSHSVDGTTIVENNSVACQAGGYTTPNSYYRTYVMADFGLGPDFQVCAVTFGVEIAENELGDDQPIEVRLYDSADLSTLGPADMIAEVELDLPDQTFTFVYVPIVASTNTGELTVEVHAEGGLDDLKRFFIGSNNLGQTSPSYIRADDCGIATPVDLADLGFPNVHFLLDVHGFAGDCPEGDGLGGGNFLFVSDSESDAINVPAVLTGDGHTVTVVIDDYNDGTGMNTVLLGDLTAYDGVFWSATGSGSGDTHDQAVIDNLEAYVLAGGCVYVTGYDSTASPDDPVLRTFLGAGDGTDTPDTPTGPLVGANSLTTGVVDVEGVLPANPPGDRDQLEDLAPDTVGVLPSFDSSGGDGWQWTLRTLGTLGAGQVAYVSNGNSDGEEIGNWLVTSPLEDACYNASLRNFAAACANGVLPGDCNGNGIADVCDIENGFSEDCNDNGIPDECDTDPVEVIDPDAKCSDECVDAPLVCPGIIYEDDNFGATPSIYPPFQCGLFQGVHDVYCRYVPAYAGTAFIRVEGPRDQWVYSVHTDCPATLANQVDCNELEHFEVVWDVTAGETYYIRIAALNFNRGAFEMTLVGPPCLLAPNDANANEIPDECECPADVNGDGVVDLIDFYIVSASQGPCPTPPLECPADVDGNGVVDPIDGMIVAASFGPCPNRDR